MFEDSGGNSSRFGGGTASDARNTAQVLTSVIYSKYSILTVCSARPHSPASSTPAVIPESFTPRRRLCPGDVGNKTGILLLAACFYLRRSWWAYQASNCSTCLSAVHQQTNTPHHYSYRRIYTALVLSGVPSARHHRVY